MPGHPHYRNSQASMNNFEPVFTAQFEVSITPPAGISEWELTLENITKISGLDVNKMPEVIKDQKYKGVIRSHIGGAVPENPIEISLDFELNLNDSNSMYTYKALRLWTDRVYNPLTGTFGLKKEYIGGPLIVSQFNKKGDIFRQITFPVVFPSAAIPLPSDLDWSENGIFKLTDFKLTADYWDESWI